MRLCQNVIVTTTVSVNVPIAGTVCGGTRPYTVMLWFEPVPVPSKQVFAPPVQLVVAVDVVQELERAESV